MKNTILQVTSLLILCIVFLTSCSAIEGIFKAGMGVGIFIVVAIIAIIVFVAMRFGKKNA
jgi:predicted Na+-dependent transporter